MTCLPPERKCPKCEAYSNTNSWMPPARDIRSKGFNGILPKDEYCVFCGSKLIKEERLQPPSYRVKKKRTIVTTLCLKCKYKESNDLNFGESLRDGFHCPSCGVKFTKKNLKTIETEEEFETVFSCV